MIDWLAIWLGAQGMGFVFKPILDKLAEDVAKDWAKDLCKESIKSVFKGRDEWTKAAGKALAQFLVEFRAELISAGLTDADCREYTEPLQSFVSRANVRAALGAVITDANPKLDQGFLSRTWNELHLPELPGDFRWRALANRYQTSASAIAREFPEVQRRLDSTNLQRLADTAEQAAALPPGFDLVRYAPPPSRIAGRNRRLLPRVGTVARLHPAESARVSRLPPASP